VPRLSAGLLLYRMGATGIEVLLVHPGGPFWARRDTGAWSIPKGEYEPGEDPRRRAEVEFSEELGSVPPSGPRRDLDEVTQAGGKRVRAWAVRGEFDPTAQAWMDSEKQPVSGRIAGDFSGNDDVRDVAYVLTRPDGTRRVVVLAGGINRYDATFTHLAIAARIPKANLNAIQWNGDGPPYADGDALLLVRNADDPGSGLVVAIFGKDVTTAVPADYQSIHLH